MGRRKVELKRIEDKSSRQVSFSKRRKGLFKKARELSILCDVNLAVLVSSSRGKLHHFSTTTSLNEILELYWRHHKEGSDEAYGDDIESEVHYGKYANMKSTDLLQVVEREADNPNEDGLTTTDLMLLERKLGSALEQVRDTKAKLLFKSLHVLREKENSLRQQNELLEKQITAMKNDQETKMAVADYFPEQETQTLRLLVR